jgi:hypothetical protein
VAALRRRVCPEYTEAVPRLKDRVHIQDLDGAGLTTMEIEAQLPTFCEDRLKEIRATE